MNNPATLATLDSLGFPEALRWRQDELWFSDMFRGNVVSWNPKSSSVVRLSHSEGGPAMPGGLGWTPAGQLLVVDCLEKKVLIVGDEGRVSTYADLSELTDYPLNDMHVDPDGTAWVGGYGFDPENQEPVGSPLFKISTDGVIEISATQFVFPNGCERFGSLIAVAETFADRVSFFDSEIEIVNSYSFNQGSGPDGLSFGPDGTLFVASAFTGEITSFGSEGKSELFYKLTSSASTPGGARGIFDCAVHPTNSQLAFSSACLDEQYSKDHDTGCITLVSL
jgi:sugar lactone lactonase YvrE